MKLVWLALALGACTTEAPAQHPAAPEDPTTLPVGDDAGDEVASPPAPAPSDSGSACIALSAADGMASDDCFPFDTCKSCDIAQGVLYWCAGDAGAAAHPALSGCESDNAAQVGWVGACCPASASSCTRFASNDTFCKSQNLPGLPMPTVAYACVAGGDGGPAAQGCQPPYMNSDAAAGAAQGPAEHASLYCCAN